MVSVVKHPPSANARHVFYRVLRTAIPWRYLHRSFIGLRRYESNCFVFVRILNVCRFSCWLDRSTVLDDSG